MTLKVNDNAPAFSMPSDTGDTVDLNSFADKHVVLYFYPKDDTPGCTKQAIAFTEHQQDFADKNAVVIGVSKDSIAKHQKFRDKHTLSVVLASDEDGDTCESYGVWKEKSMFGKKYMGIERTTFLLSPITDGARSIKQIWPKVKVTGHAKAVLKAMD